MVYQLRIIFKRTRTCSSREVESLLAFSGVSLDTPIRRQSGGTNTDGNGGGNGKRIDTSQADVSKDP
eukprot:COSAG05_NODE_767_length_7468_cov_379.770118_1_plen_67_part_00